MNTIKKRLSETKGNLTTRSNFKINAEYVLDVFDIQGNSVIFEYYEENKVIVTLDRFKFVDVLYHKSYEEIIKERNDLINDIL